MDHGSHSQEVILFIHRLDNRDHMPINTLKGDPDDVTDLFDEIFFDLAHRRYRGGVLHSVQRINGDCTAYIHKGITIPIPHNLVLIGRQVGFKLRFHEGFLYRDLTDKDMEDFLFHPYTLPKLCIHSHPVETPSLYRGGLPMYRSKTFYVKQFIRLIDVRILLSSLLFVIYSFLCSLFYSFISCLQVKASEINPLCKLTRVNYRDWDILAAIWDILWQQGYIMYQGNSTEGSFHCYGHNMLNQDIMVTTNMSNEIEDVFHIDEELLDKISQRTVYYDL